MEELVRAALIGTAKQSADVAASDHPAESLVASVAADDKESALLLRAGVRSVFDRCGRKATTGVSAPAPAPEETLQAASGKLVGILQSAMHPELRDLLTEFIGCMADERMLLPPELLPQALDIRGLDLRVMLQPLLGERGRWLAGFNADWKWATLCFTDAPEHELASLNKQWDEGDLGERCRALQNIRRIEPATARKRLAEAIDTEKPEYRVRLLQTLEIGLSAEDESFLESRLDDRSALVRSAAAVLLARLPESALASRMKQRADEVLSFEQKGVLRKKMSLVCQPPEEIDKSWQQDGIPLKPPAGRGKRAFWTEAVLSFVPPAHWRRRFEAEPQALIDAVAKDDFAQSVLAGWTRAATVLADVDKSNAEWLGPLWNYWVSAAGKRGKKPPDVSEHLRSLLRAMPAEEAEAALLPLLDDVAPGDTVDVLAMLDCLPRPWGSLFGRRYLKIIRKVLKRRADNLAYHWAETLHVAARALPEDAFSAALEPWDIPESRKGGWHAQASGKEIDKFTETIQMRRSFYEEMRG